MIKISLLVLLSMITLMAKSQVTYTMSSIPYAPDPYTGGTNLGLTTDDMYSGVIPIGFTFNYFGTNYDSIVVSTNGSVSFDVTHANTNCSWLANFSIPSVNNDINNAILSPFQDLNPATSSAGYHINVDLKGTAPYRRLVISYDSVSLFSCTSVTFSNQVILYETTFEIDINIKDKLLCPNWNSGSAILGIQNSTGTVAYCPPGRNGLTPWTASQESWRFSPSNGGPANTGLCKVKGNIFFDGNSNCSKDAAEYANMNRFVLTDIGNYYAYTDANGNYEMLVNTGNYVVSHNPYGNVSVLCPPSNNYNVALVNPGDSITNIDFGDSTQICTDLYTSVGVSTLRYCDSNLVTVPFGNLGSIPENNAVLTVTVPANTYPSNFSIIPTSQSGNTFTFNVGTINPGQQIYLTFIDSLICDTLLIGSSQCFSTSITGTNSDCDASNNIDTSCFTVVASYDPNMVQASVEHISNAPFVSNGEFISNEWITYKIDFQNTGTTSALNIRVRDILDINRVDINTVRMIGSSHLATMVQNGNTLDFYFNGINLLDSNTNEALSHGWLTFKVKSNTGLPNFAVLNNTADIYFDNNPAIQTNTCSLVINIPESVSTVSENRLEMFPNPMKESTVIKLKTGMMKGDITMYNSFGQKVFSKAVNSSTITIDRNNLAEGIYSLKFVSIDGKVYFNKLTIK